MRIGLVLYGTLDSVSGGYLYDRELARSLRESGHHVEVIPLPLRTYPLYLLDNVSPGLAVALRARRFDLLLQDELSHPSLVLLNRRLKRQGFATPVVSIVHHPRFRERWPNWQRALYRAVEIAYLRTVDAFVYNSRPTRADVQACLRATPPGVVAWPGRDGNAEPLTPLTVARRARAPGPLRLVFLGNLIPRKRLTTLLRAIARLPRGICTLDVIGGFRADPPYARRAWRLTHHLDLQPHVRFHGYLASDQRDALLANAHLTTVPSDYEGFGITHLEGMSFGLPAIASAAGGAADLVAHGQNGYLVPPGDALQIAHHLLTLARDRSLLERLSLNAHARYLAHPTWEQTGFRARTFLEGYAGHVEREGSDEPHS